MSFHALDRETSPCLFCDSLRGACICLPCHIGTTGFLQSEDSHNSLLGGLPQNQEAITQQSNDGSAGGSELNPIHSQYWRKQPRLLQSQGHTFATYYFPKSFEAPVVLN